MRNKRLLKLLNITNTKFNYFYLNQLAREINVNPSTIKSIINVFKTHGRTKTIPKRIKKKF